MVVLRSSRSYTHDVETDKDDYNYEVHDTNNEDSDYHMHGTNNEDDKNFVEDDKSFVEDEDENGDKVKTSLKMKKPSMTATANNSAKRHSRTENPFRDTSESVLFVLLSTSR